MNRYGDQYANDAEREQGYHDYLRNRDELAAVFGGGK